MTISDIVLKNGSSTLKNLYPLVKVLTKEDKASLAAKGYAPGFTAAEWPYDLPAEKIYYSNSLFPGTFYFDDGPVIPIVIDLHIVGSQRMKLQEISEEFCAFVKRTAAKLAAPTLEQVSSYLLSLDDGFRADVLEAYIRNSPPSPQLCDLFMAYYTMSDYGAGRYHPDTIRKLFSGRSAGQKQAVADALADYPDVVPVYRGEAEGSTSYRNAFSWSLDINTAFFFACRHGDKNHARIIRAKACKKDILAVSLDSREREIFLLPDSIFDAGVEKLIGPDSTLVMPPKYADVYAAGRRDIQRLYRSRRKEMKSGHDMIHSARVLFLACAIIQAGKLKLTVAELKQLSQAIVYHDIGRQNDAEDDGHGLAGRQIYEESRHDAVTAFLIEFHCRKDEDAYRHLQASGIKVKQRTWLLYQTLKDADALDRVRFGIYALDVNYLRLPISHKLVPLAVAAETGIQL